MRQRPGQHPASSSRNTHSRTSLSPSAGTKAPTQGEDGNSRLSTGFLEHRPVTSPPTNQKKVTHPAALTPNFAYKNFSPKTIGEFRFFEHQPPVLLARPCNKPFSAPNSDTWVCLDSPCTGHTNLRLATLYWYFTPIFHIDTNILKSLSGTLIFFLLLDPYNKTPIVWAEILVSLFTAKTRIIDVPKTRR